MMRSSQIHSYAVSLVLHSGDRPGRATRRANPSRKGSGKLRIAMVWIGRMRFMNKINIKKRQLRICKRHMLHSPPPPAIMASQCRKL